MLLRNARLQNVQLTRIQADAVVELLRRRVLCLTIRQEDLRWAHLEDHVADFGIADVAEVLRRKQDDAVHAAQRLQPVAEAFAENVVSEVCPGLVERYQGGRAVQTLLDS